MDVKFDKNIEYKIGDQVEINGIKYIVHESQEWSCIGCSLLGNDGYCKLYFEHPLCNRYERKDCKNIIFKPAVDFTVDRLPFAVDNTNFDIMTDIQERIRKVRKGTVIPASLYDRLDYLGIIPHEARAHNVGASDYSKHTIQPWSIWLDYPELTSWDHDIIKRVLRTKEGNPRELDYEKIIHICQERIRQIKTKKQ